MRIKSALSVPHTTCHISAAASLCTLIDFPVGHVISALPACSCLHPAPPLAPSSVWAAPLAYAQSIVYSSFVVAKCGLKMARKTAKLINFHLGQLQMTSWLNLSSSPLSSLLFSPLCSFLFSAFSCLLFSYSSFPFSSASSFPSLPRPFKCPH